MLAQIDGLFFKLSLKKTFTRIISYIFYEGRPLTTRGRWFNPFVFFLYNAQLLLPPTKSVQNPLYIVGTGRSGTTILGVTLGMHNDIGFLNEPKAIWSFLFEFEDLIGSYHENEGYYRLTSKEVSSKLIHKAHRIFGNYLRFSLSTRVLDKYPEMIFRTEFIQTIFPDARFLFLCRNGIDVCQSIEKWSHQHRNDRKGTREDWWGKNNRKWKLLCEQIVSKDNALGSNLNKIETYTNQVHMAAVEWIVTMKEGIKLMQQKPEVILTIKYEDYVSHSSVRDDVIEFCGLSADPNYEEYCKNTLKFTSKKHKISFPEEIQPEFERVMKELGYEP